MAYEILNKHLFLSLLLIMLRKALQQSFKRTSLVQPLVANRLFSIHAAQRQESGTLKPTSGKLSLSKRNKSMY